MSFSCNKLFFIFILSLNFFSATLAADSTELVLLKRLEASIDTSHINVLNDLSRYWMGKGEFKIALSYSLQAREALSKLKISPWPKGILATYDNLGTVHLNEGAYDKALEVYISMKKLFEKFDQTFEVRQGIGIAYRNMGLVYINQGDNPKALECYRASLKLYVEDGDRKGIAAVYSYIGNAYDAMGNTDSSLIFLERSLKIRREIGDKRGEAACLNNIGNTYDNLEDYKKALDYYTQSMRIKEEMGNRKGLATSCINIGSIYLKMKNTSGAQEFLEKAFVFSEESGNVELIKVCYELFAQLWEMKGDHKKALEYFKKFSDVKDSILDVSSRKNIAEMNAKYETEKKDKELILKDAEIAVADAENKSKSLQRNAFIVGFAFMILVAIIVFRGYRQKKEANVMLNLQNELIEKQKRVVEEHNRQVTDSINYAQRIQEALFPSLEEVKKVFPESMIYYAPKDLVSGDFYWVHELDPEKVLFAVADCTGHGVPGAFMSIMGINLLEQVVKERKIQDPAEILEELSRSMKESLRQTGGEAEVKDGMDIALCLLNRKSLELKYAGARNSVFVVQQELLEELKATKRSIGNSWNENLSFSSEAIKLSRGSMLYLFTDGYMDQKGGVTKKKMGRMAFADLIRSKSSLEMPAQCDAFTEAMNTWRVGIDQIDDMLIFGIRVN